MNNRRFALYFAWSRPEETGADLGVLENRYPTLFEFRRVLWPGFEHAKPPGIPDQGIAGFLDQVVLGDFQVFIDTIEAATGQQVKLIQRETSHSVENPINKEMLDELDTLIIISLDHQRTLQSASASEIAALNEFLERESSCLIICPHHDIGAEDDLSTKEQEFFHHGDRLVPEQQRIGGFARSLFAELRLPIAHRFGLSPKRDSDGTPANLDIDRANDELGLFVDVSTFNKHPHLPHLEITAMSDEIQVLARQSIHPEAVQHPFFKQGNNMFNAFLRVQPASMRKGNIFVCDATLWSSAFGGVGSLKALWRNLACI